MKRWIALLCALVLGLCACGKGADTKGSVKVYVLAGPTGVGSVNLWDRSDKQSTELLYDFTLTSSNDEVVAALSAGKADIAAVATNLAAALYNKTNGGVTVLAVNTTGVLSVLSNGTPVSGVTDLKGKTICAIGQGANPEYILRYVLMGNGLDPDKDVTLQFVGGADELTGVWQEDPDALILAPQPAATSLLLNNRSAARVLDMTEEWDKIAADSSLVMGCVIVRNAFLEAYPDAVKTFLEEYKASVETAMTDVTGTADLCERYGIIPKAALAQKAIPSCGLTFMTGSEMKQALQGYLQVMYDADPKSVGGNLPKEDFYYETK